MINNFLQRIGLDEQELPTYACLLFQYFSTFADLEGVRISCPINSTYIDIWAYDKNHFDLQGKIYIDDVNLFFILEVKDELHAFGIEGFRSSVYKVIRKFIEIVSEENGEE
ncbi:hypothetical protein [Commensalibacter communis]|nr:hypothetical protein [Commensalibacter communis]